MTDEGYPPYLHGIMPKMPPHSQLMLPLMAALDEMGGAARPSDVMAHVCEALALPDEVMSAAVKTTRGKNEPAIGKRLRWVRQDLVRKGFLSREKRRWWELTEAGTNFLHNCRPAVVVTVFETAMGAALWAEAEAAAGIMRDDSVRLVLTSPPYPLVKAKTYGNRVGAEYLEWLLALARDWHRVLADDGSLVLNLADVYLAGTPTLSLYQEKLLIALVEDVGFHFAQRFSWWNKSKMPSSQWVTVRRVRVNQATENIFWLGKTPHPKANNRNVLRPYAASMQRNFARTDHGKKRPSGHGDWRGGFKKDHGGSIPHNVLVASNSISNDAYCRGCRQLGLPVHPARFPSALPEFFIKLTTDAEDVVYDPFGGSGQTAEACERLGRHWVTSDKSLAYIRGSALRFPQATHLLNAAALPPA